jgi:hypothetical protein
MLYTHSQRRTEGWGGGVGSKAPPSEIRKALQNRAKLNPLVKYCSKIAEFGTPTPQEIIKKGSKIPKLPPVRNCFTLAMTNKLDVTINVQKIKKILLYEIKFLVPNYSCLQNPLLEELPPSNTRSLCPLPSA